ncbi:hypothetical protein [Lentibacillus daqui]|nr:hypothetical protein [Lentibacillus daqui]
MNIQEEKKADLEAAAADYRKHPRKRVDGIACFKNKICIPKWSINFHFGD